MEKYRLEQVAVRLVQNAPLLSEEKIQTPKDAIKILANTFQDFDREVIGVVHLRPDKVPINMTIASIGTLDTTLSHPRELLKAAFLSNADSILLFHNHPSGNLSPSREDIALTIRMQQLCTLAGIPVLDHIILGGNCSYYSFLEKNILPLDQVHYSTELDSIDLKAAEYESQKYKSKERQEDFSKKTRKNHRKNEIEL